MSGDTTPNAIQRLRANKHHSGGFEMEVDRGDGFNWLVCIDCGTEWAEHDDGSLAAGYLECEPPDIHDALDAVDALYQAAQHVIDPLGNGEIIAPWVGSELAAAVRRVNGDTARNELPRPYGRSREDYPA